MTLDFTLFSDKAITPEEYADLMTAVGWVGEGDYDEAAIRRSLAAYPCIVHARDAAGTLVGYASAFSDGAFSTFVGEIVVRTGHQQSGIGSALLRQIEKQYPGVPIFVHSFEDVKPFFLRNGYRVAERPTYGVFKIPEAAVAEPLLSR